MKPGFKSLLLAHAVFALPVTAAAEISVVASFKPVHSLVASVMEGVSEPSLIVEGSASPHTYSLKPSQASALQDADVVFWIGHELEAFLEKPLESLGKNARAVSLIDSESVTKLPFREGGAFEKHSHDEEVGHDHAAKEEAGHDHGAKDEEKHADAGHDHAAEGHGEFDAHVWLDPRNASVFADVIASTLAKADAANAARYQANAATLKERLAALETELATTLEPVKGKGFIVFHDAYQYFENRFGVTAAGSITVSPEVMPGAERVREIREKVRNLGATCVFSEPQFEPKLVSVVVEGTGAKTVVLDPEGGGGTPGTEQYFSLMRGLAKSLRDCLSPAS